MFASFRYTVYFVLTDHLGSTTLTTQPDGTPISELRYTAYGEERYASGETPTGYRYTGQLSKMDTTGLYYYGARWYDPAIMAFASADTLIPDPSNPLDWNRYMYVGANPINRDDPTGHAQRCPDDTCGSGGSTMEQLRQAREQGKSNSHTPPPPSAPQFFEVPENQQGTVITNECLQSSPCMGAWEDPHWWDTNPKNPDYYVLTISAGKVGGITVILVYDRFSNVYVGIGGNIGKSISPVTGSLNGGWIGSSHDNRIPDQANISSFLTGLAINGQAGVVGNVAGTWSPFANDYISHTAKEYGGVLPFSIGVSATYSFMIVDGNKNHRR